MGDHKKKKKKKAGASISRAERCYDNTSTRPARPRGDKLERENIRRRPLCHIYAHQSHAPCCIIPARFLPLTAPSCVFPPALSPSPSLGHPVVMLGSATDEVTFFFLFFLFGLKRKAKALAGCLSPTRPPEDISNTYREEYLPRVNVTPPTWRATGAISLCFDLSLFTCMISCTVCCRPVTVASSSRKNSTTNY